MSNAKALQLATEIWHAFQDAPKYENGVAVGNKLGKEKAASLLEPLLEENEKMKADLAKANERISNYEWQINPDRQGGA